MITLSTALGIASAVDEAVDILDDVMEEAGLEDTALGQVVDTVDDFFDNLTGEEDE